MLKQSNKVLFTTMLLLGLFALGSFGVYYAGAQAQNTNNTNNNTAQNNNQNNNQNNAGASNDAPNILDYGQLQDESTGAQKKSYESTLYKVNLDTFEEGGNWSINMPSDFGAAMLLPRDGVPNALKNDSQSSVLTVNEGQNGNSSNQNGGNNGQAQANNNANANNGQQSNNTQGQNGSNGSASSTDPNQNNSSGYFVNEPDAKKQILGVKMNFFGGRKTSWMRINLNHPMSLNGLVKGFEVWVVGRDLPHHLYMIVEDQDQKEKLIDAGSLNFIGWRKVVAQVPFYINQSNSHGGARGIIFKGFLVTFDLANAYGNYYVYFDNLSAEVSRFMEENALPDNPKDLW